MSSNSRRNSSFFSLGGALSLGATTLIVIGFVLGECIPLLPARNPKSLEVVELARPIVAVIDEFRAQHADAPPRDLAELLRSVSEHEPRLLANDGSLPLDPWGRPLLYETSVPPHYTQTYIRSLGAEGREGGFGENRDIAVWAGDR